VGRTRIGDVERDQTVAALAEHYVAGRLDLTEFEERTAAALRARTRADLETTLLDLPVAASSTAQPARRRRRKLRLAIAAACVSLAVGVAITGGDSAAPQPAVPVCPPAAVAGPEAVEC
jgi:hypothetical protein